MEPASPALADGFFTTEPPGKPWGQKLSYWSLYSDSQLSYRDKWSFILLALHSPSLILLCITPTSGFTRASGQFNSVQSLSCVRLFATPRLQHARPPCPSPTPGVYSNSCPLSQWCYPTISSSVVPFSSRIRVRFKWISSSHQVAKVLEFQLQHQSFQWIVRIDFL